MIQYIEGEDENIIVDYRTHCCFADNIMYVCSLPVLSNEINIYIFCVLSNKINIYIF